MLLRNAPSDDPWRKEAARNRMVSANALNATTTSGNCSTNTPCAPRLRQMLFVNRSEWDRPMAPSSPDRSAVARGVVNEIARHDEPRASQGDARRQPVTCLSAGRRRDLEADEPDVFRV